MNKIEVINKIKRFSIKQLDFSLSFEENVKIHFGEEALELLFDFFNKYNSNTQFSKENPLLNSEVDAIIVLSLHDLGKTYYQILEDKSKKKI